MKTDSATGATPEQPGYSTEGPEQSDHLDLNEAESTTLPTT